MLSAYHFLLDLWSKVLFFATFAQRIYDIEWSGYMEPSAVLRSDPSYTTPGTDEMENYLGDCKGISLGNRPDMHHAQQHRQYLTSDDQVIACDEEGVATWSSALSLCLGDSFQ
eukprot:g29875.t1